MWGIDAIGYNVQTLKAIAPDAPVGSWSLILDPKWAAKFKDCGISILDAPDEVVSVVLIYLGKDPNSINPADLKAVEEVLGRIRPYVRMINSSQYIDSLANGDICLALGWNGDILMAKRRAEEAGQGVQIGLGLPKEGSVVWFDMLAIPADAPHTDNAYALINYLMRPDVAAANSKLVHYANGNAASLPLLDPTIRNDAGIYPTKDVTARLYPSLARTPEYMRLMNRAWTRFTTGR